MSLMDVKASLGIAGGVLAVSAVLAGLEGMGVIEGNIAERAIGIVLGLVVILYGNEIPKILAPMDRGADPARRQALQRFAGWVMVLGGVGYLLAFALMPIEYAAYAAIACGVVAIGIVFARCLMVRTIV